MELLPGQRWYSSAEPELGLGTVMRVQGRQVQIVFTGSGELRHYALHSAPLLRARFHAGDRVRIGGAEMTVESVQESQGILRYLCIGSEHDEGELDAEQPISQADARLLSGRVDRNQQFELRCEVLRRRAASRAHPGWGLLGARMDLIPHQLRVIELALRRRPLRLLLADEVGLGKTIEACAIVSRRLADGRARRVLVLTPESLCNQWFVELYRRFQLRFSLFDEERCEAIEMNGEGINPFEQEQCVIASVDWLAADPKRAEQLLQADFDTLLVDEAHHLVWSEAESSPAYALVERLAARIEDVLLLTATPEQLGLAGHFARLRLLDPARYTSLADFESENARYLELSELVRAIEAGESLPMDAMPSLGALFSGDEDRFAQLMAAYASDPTQVQDDLLSELIDRHGTGRVMLRHRRAQVGGFPQRVASLDTLPATDDTALRGRLRAEFEHDMGLHAQEPEHDYLDDPRFAWLLRTLDAIAPAKVLLLCRSRAKVQALEEALRIRSGIATARFHEDMSLLQRDRNAAYFAEADGARLLIASEIGAEGRNFQFAQHLILWDLPPHPDMLEQRIGRLDRIGQCGDVHLHACAVEGSPQSALLRWYAEGLEAFEKVIADGSALQSEFRTDLLEAALADEYADAVQDLLRRSREHHQRLREAIERGRDRLLELGTRYAVRDPQLGDALREADARDAEDDYPLRLLESFGIHSEPLSPQVQLLDPEYLSVEGFEELREGARQATTHRQTALARDDLLYLRADHPMLLSAEESLLGGETGNATCLIDDSLPSRSVVLQCVHVLDCVAERRLQMARWFPNDLLVISVDTKLQVLADFAPNPRAVQRAGDRLFDLQSMRKVLAGILPPMLQRVKREIGPHLDEARKAAERRAVAFWKPEIQRIRHLARINPAVHPEEIEAMEDEFLDIINALPQAHARLDALRLVVSPDFFGLRR